MDKELPKSISWMELHSKYEEAKAKAGKLEADFIRLHELATKWVDKDHHDWQELMKLRWG